MFRRRRYSCTRKIDNGSCVRVRGLNSGMEQRSRLGQHCSRSRSGHFEGGSVLHWPARRQWPRRAADRHIIQVVQDRRYVSFMRSYPNLIPLGPAAIRRITMRSNHFVRSNLRADGGSQRFVRRQNSRRALGRRLSSRDQQVSDHRAANRQSNQSTGRSCRRNAFNKSPMRWRSEYRARADGPIACASLNQSQPRRHAERQRA